MITLGHVNVGERVNITMFDFLKDEKVVPLVPDVVHHGPNGTTLKKTSRKDVIQDFLDVYKEENGKELIRLHMKHDPKSFFEVLKKLIPNNIGFGDGEALNITLIDKFGNKIEMKTPSEGQELPSDRDLTSHQEAGGLKVDVKETFGPSPPQSVTGSNPEFDFTV